MKCCLAKDPKATEPSHQWTGTSKAVIQNKPFLFRGEHFKHFVTVRESWLNILPKQTLSILSTCAMSHLGNPYAHRISVLSSIRCSHYLSSSFSLGVYLRSLWGLQSPNLGLLVLVQVDGFSFSYLRRQYSYATFPSIFLLHFKCSWSPTISWPVCSFCLRKGSGLNHFQDKLVNY